MFAKYEIQILVEKTGMLVGVINTGRQNKAGC